MTLEPPLGISLTHLVVTLKIVSDLVVPTRPAIWRDSLRRLGRRCDFVTLVGELWGSTGVQGLRLLWALASTQRRTQGNLTSDRLGHRKNAAVRAKNDLIWLVPWLQNFISYLLPPVLRN